jgi:uncharacterized protein (UPF0335 family)
MATKTIADLGNKSAKELADFVLEIESLIDDRATVNERIKGKYAAAVAVGFEKKAIQQLIKERASDSENTVEMRATVETYRRAIAGLAGTPLGDWARGWMADSERNQRRAKEASQVFEDFMERTKGKKTDDAPQDDTDSDET